MAKKQASKLARFEQLVNDLQAQRREHLDTVAQIDSTLQQFGIAPDAPRHLGQRRRRPGTRPTRRAVSKAPSRRGRPRSARTGAPTAEQFVLSLLGNGKTLTTGEINEQWQKAGRAGRADNTLSKLTHEKKLKRHSRKGQRGSAYQKA